MNNLSILKYFHDFPKYLLGSFLLISIFSCPSVEAQINDDRIHQEYPAPTAHEKEIKSRNIKLFNGDPALLEKRRERLKLLREKLNQENCSHLPESFNLNGFVKRDIYDSAVLFSRDLYCTDCQQESNMSEKVYKEINRNRPSKISFNKNKLYPFDDGGTCSAMALDFISRYKTECEGLNNPNDKRTCVSSFAPYYRASTSTYMSSQAAYNTIEVNKAAYRSNPEKFKERKIQALANYHKLKLKPVTKSIKHSSIYNNSSSFESKVNNLPSGTYVIRALSPTNNTKMEWYGHTMILIKGNDFSLYYDNSEGAEEIIGDVGRYVASVIIDWGIPEVRIYNATCPSSGCTNLSLESYALHDGNIWCY